jgi:hypothetical protein
MMSTAMRPHPATAPTHQPVLQGVACVADGALGRAEALRRGVGAAQGVARWWEALR